MKKLTFICFLILVYSCTPSPEPIAYGSDLCHSCKMTIVDNQHAGQLVTSKGKNFKFDAIECMIPHLLSQGATDYSHLLVSDYEYPGKMMDAKSSAFLISEKIPSPMGGFLSAFGNAEKAEQLAQNQNGKVFNWQEIQQVYQSKIANFE